MTKKLMVMVVAAVAAVFGAWADTWADPDTDYTWTYQINGDTAEIYNGFYSAAILPSPTGAVTIPSTLGGKPVTSIGGHAFIGCRELTSVTIPDSVTSIGDGAFSVCTSLTDVTIPNGVISIGSSAFESCRSFRSVTIPGSVTSIGSRAFYDCSGITSVTIPDTVTSIGYEAFTGCSYVRSLAASAVPRGMPTVNLTSVSIPDSVTNIASSAFSGCSGLTSVTIPEFVTSIGNSAFSGCSGLASVKIPDGVTSIGYSAFSGCSRLTSVTIPDSVTGIGQDAFSGCSRLTSVTIPDSVTGIGQDAFSGCSRLTSVTIPDSVTSIGQDAFSGCSEDLYDTTTIPGVKIVDNWVVGYTDALSGDLDLTGIRGIGNSAFSGCSRLTSVTIPDSVTSIGYSAFYGCSRLTSVSIPDSVTRIGDAAFYGCSGLTSVIIGNAVTSIGSWAFYDCSGLTSVTIGDGVTSIGSGAFYNCSGLTGVTIGNGVTSIGYEAFRGCSRLTSVSIPDSVTSIGYSAFSGCSGLTSVTIPDSMTSIGWNAFSECTNVTSLTAPAVPAGMPRPQLTSVTIPNSVRSIGNSAFSGCSGLTSVKIPDSVTSIGDSAFRDCSGLASVTIPDSVTSIGQNPFSGCSEGLYDTITILGVKIVDGWAVGNTGSLSGSLDLTGVRGIGGGAFYGCSGLTSVTIGDSVTSIGSSAFSSCSGLTSVHITDLTKWCGISFGNCDANPLSYAHNLYLNGEKITDLVITDGVVSIGSEAFCGCSGLTSVTIPDSVTSIGSEAFYGCSGLTSVTIPDSVTSIGEYAFKDCSNLTSVSIPDSVTSIGTGAFVGCSLSPDSDGFVIAGGTLYGYHGDCSEVTVPESVTTIWGMAFSNHVEITSLTIPNSVTNIAEVAFYGCDNLQRLTVPYVPRGDEVWDGGYNTRSGLAFFFTKTAWEYVITHYDPYWYQDENGEWVEDASPQYRDCLVIKGGSVPETLKTVVVSSDRGIGDNAFYYCSKLNEIWLPKNMKNVDIGQTSASVFYYGKFTRIKSERLTTEDSGAFSVETIATNDCRVTFEWKCSCESMRKGKMYDYLSFSIDGEQKAAICGETGWTRQVYMVEGSGEHVLKWTYQKDANGSDGEDCGWLRLVSVAPPVTLSFLPGGATAGEVPPAMPLYADDEPVTLPSKGTLAWPKHNFRGWSDGETTFVPGTQYPCDAESKTLTAVWARKEIAAPTVRASGVSFYQGETATITISAETGATICYTLDGSMPTAESLHYVGSFAVSETTTIRAIAVKDDYFDSEEAKLTVTKDPTTYGDAVNAPTFAFSSNDGTGWRIACGESPDGLALRSGPISHNATSRLETVVMGEGVVTFSFKVAGEVIKGDVYDGLAFLIDGVQQGELMGDTEWTTNTYSVVGEGMHTLSWLYVKDEGDDEPVVGDCAWLDEVVWASTRNVTVAFDANGGELPVLDSSRGVMVNTAIGELPLPLYAGYTFLGWFTAAEGGEQISSATIMICDATYYAHWTETPRPPDPVPEPIWTIDSDGVLTKVDLNGCTDIVIPDSVTSIGDYAFNGCSGLASVTIPDGVTSIGNYAFYNCSGLTSVTIPDGVTSIGDYAFYNCSGLAYVKLGSGVISIGEEAFGGCVDVQDFIVDVSNRSYKSSNGFLLAADGTTIICAPEGRSDIVIPDGVTRIGAYSFADRENLTSVTIPDSVTVIEDGAFRECYSLTNVVLSANLKSLGYTREGWDAVGVFEGCTGLRIIVLPDGVVNIGYGSFSDCENLASITIPDSVTNIGSYAFEDCSGLVSVTIGSGVTNIGYGAFYCWSESLASIVFEGNAPNGVDDAFDSDSSCTVYVPRGSTGWGVEIPGIWNGMRIEYAEDVSPDVWTVTFDANGGELADGDSSRQVEDGTPLGELPVPSRLDYAFLGWFTAAEGGERVTVETTISADIMLYAHWRCLFDGSWTQGADGVWSSGETADDSEKPQTMTVEGAGTVTFRWKVSCEDYFVFRTQKILCDHLSFRIDGEEQALINADTDWTECSFAVAGGGRHTLAWVYVKDSEGSDGEDCAWLDDVSWTPSEVANVSVDADKGEIEKTDGGYVVTAKDGVALTEGDFTFGAIAKEAYKIEIAEDGKSATVKLVKPQIGAAAEETDEKDEEDATGLLVVVDEAEISAKPEAKAGEAVGALPAKTYPGLYYQASWGGDLNNLTLGEKVQATGESLYLGVIKQTGDKGFYKLSVSEK